MSSRPALAQVIGDWNFNEAATGNVGTTPGSILDISGQGLNGFGVGTPTPVYLSGIDECDGTAALRFTTGDDAVQIPDHPALHFGAGASFTVEATIRATFTGRAAGIVVKRVSSTNSGPRPGFWLRGVNTTVNGQSIVVIEGIIIDADGNDRISGTHAITDGQWHHVALVYAADEHELRVYRDHALEGTVTLTRGDTSNSAPLIIGDWYDANTNQWDGDIDRVRITARALAPEEFLPVCDPSPGACCLPDQACQETLEADCLGTWHGPNTHCADVVCLPEPPTPDLVRDGVADSADLDAFIACVTGPSVLASAPDCTRADYDGDGDVDSADFGRFQRCFGSGPPVDGACLYGPPELLSVEKIWDYAPHNAFTDLIRFHDAWYCALREAPSHSVTPAGDVRIIASPDGHTWTSVAFFDTDHDMRDAKLSITPDGRLMALMCERYAANNTGCTSGDAFKPDVSFSSDGRNWTPPQRVTVDGQEPDCEWLWRVIWHNGTAYGTSYAPITTGPRELSIWSSLDGVHYESIAAPVVPDGAGETTIRFLAGDVILALARNRPNQGYLGVSAPPYTTWTWQPAGEQLGGPNYIALPDRTFVAASRYVEGGGATRTALARMTATSYQPVLVLPSGGDTGYPGLVWHDGLLWMTYYSSHEGKANVYLARIRLP